jgi:hypothetical protein
MNGPPPLTPYEGLSPTDRFGRVLCAFMVTALCTLLLPVALTSFDHGLHAPYWFVAWLAGPLSWVINPSELWLFGLFTLPIGLLAVFFAVMSVRQPRFFPYPFAVVGCILWLGTSAVPMLVLIIVGFRGGYAG